ncbi:hypothetical protein EGI22_13370 [Lacihabitans sp. LS3-19]|uniref:hypothetical protein n=1 Tax=Lacihabitans sp. LS3-19 TaxID=2487335 RepID=UPI0020CDB60D|nr:hypothetical protein [Lacihabitans sp. LS3-19]MCP9768903.1 hypothetical protein [Lacihabitans sp. LS3-19]
MAEDLFEKKIKAKLEQLDKPVTGSLWSKIESQTEKPWWVLFWRKYAWPLYATMATGVLWYTFYQNTLINEKVSNLNDELNNKTTQITETQLVNNVYHKDTIYIEKTIYIKNDNSTYSTPTEKSNKERALERYIESLKNDFEQYVKNVETKYLQPQIENINKNNQENIQGFVEAVESSNQKIIQKIEEQPAIAEKKAIKEDSLLMPTRKVETEPEAEPKKKKFTIPKTETRIGVTTGYNFGNQFAVGPVLEWFMGRSLSLDLGTSFSNYPEKEYGSTREFNIATGKDFNTIYASQLPEYEAIEDIKIRTSIVEMPINLNYYYPLNQNLDLKFSYGTHMDLRTYQTLEIELYKAGEEFTSKISNNMKNSNFHNMVFGSGLQYRRDRYIFQIFPSYTFNFREIDNQKTGGIFKLNGSILLKLNK